MSLPYIGHSGEEPMKIDVMDIAVVAFSLFAVAGAALACGIIIGLIVFGYRLVA